MYPHFVDLRRSASGRPAPLYAPLSMITGKESACFFSLTDLIIFIKIPSSISSHVLHNLMSNTNRFPPSGVGHITMPSAPSSSEAHHLDLKRVYIIWSKSCISFHDEFGVRTHVNWTQHLPPPSWHNGHASRNRLSTNS